MADERERWVNAAILIWERTAPSYVQHDVKPDILTLRGLHDAGATLQQFQDALDHGLNARVVPQRRVFRYAVNVVHMQLREARS